MHPFARLIHPLFRSTSSISLQPQKTAFAFSTISRVMAKEYKVKDLSSLSLEKGEKKEVELEGIEGGKVLLVNHNGKVHAMSSKCTHYGAPLKLGILNPEGRLTCAWHGACFNVATGDVEDAPALDPLAKFEVSEKDGAVFIKGEEETIKASRRMPNVKCKAQGKDKVVVIGGGSGAVGAVQGLREQNFKGDITMISREPYLPLDRTKLSKALIADPSKLEWRAQSWYDEAGIETLQDEVTSVDFDKKTVSTKSGKSTSYTKLILATGGTPKKLPMPGFKDLENVFLLRTVPDVQAILAAVGEDKKKNIVVIGSSFIGMEVANALSANNTVTVVGMEETPLSRIMGDQVGKIFQDLLTNNGVKFHMAASVEKALPSDSNSSKVGSVQLKDGTSLPAELVVLGVGVSPETTYLKDNPSISFEQDGSLRVDERFQVLNKPDVFAIGDIATYPYHGPDGAGKPVRIEHWNVAQNAGRSVAYSITHAGSDDKPKPFIPIFWSAMGSQLRYCGHTPNGYDDIYLDQKDKKKFAAYYGNKDTVVAVASMMLDPVMSKSAELMRRGTMPKLSEIRGGMDVLGVDLPGQVQAVL